MSLQGTLDTFAIPDVLRLLASTRKSGHLRLEGSRGSCGVWFTDGLVVALGPPRSRGAVAPSGEALFEVLRSRDGSFSFDTDVAGPVVADDGDAGDLEACDLEALLVEGEGLLEEWREVAEVVPSLACTVTLRAELATDTTMSPEHWRLVVAIAAGTTVGELGTARSLSELAISRAIKELVEAGWAQVGVTVEATPVEWPELEPVPAVDSFMRRPLGARLPPPQTPSPFPGPRPSSLGDSLGELASLEQDDTVEVARQLADLGPDATLDALEADVDGQPVNRSALLKFLSSVRT